MTTKLACLAAAVVIASDASFAAASEDQPTARGKVEVIKNSCPGEGCTFGKWRVVKPVQVYKTAHKYRSPLATLKPGDVVEAITGEMHMIPGLARVIREPLAGDRGIEIGKTLEILDYLGEGVSRTRQGTRYFRVKVARSQKDCEPDSEADWRRCWVELLRAPSDGESWVSIRVPDRGLRGWVRQNGEFAD